MVSKEVTVGNHSWIPIGGGDLHPYEEYVASENILLLLSAFEEQHNDWEVMNWHLDSRHSGLGIKNRIYGIYIDHRPKVAAVDAEKKSDQK